MNKREVGTAYEKKAGEFLEKQGLRILCRNFRNRYGEIDIVAKDGEVTVSWRQISGAGRGKWI